MSGGQSVQYASSGGKAGTKAKGGRVKGGVAVVVVIVVPLKNRPAPQPGMEGEKQIHTDTCIDGLTIMYSNVCVCV